MVSIIVPVYNTGKVLDKCLRSVLMQTYEDWECIVVNDCSTDKRTVEVLKGWKKWGDGRFLFIDKKRNEGVDMARFDALERARGDYVMFVDSDDWLDAEALKTLTDKAIEQDADVVRGENSRVFLGGLWVVKGRVEAAWKNRLISHEELMEKYYISFFGVNILPANLWGALYKRSLFVEAGVRPSCLRFGEDQVLNMRLFPFVKRFYAVDDVVYNYRVGLPGLRTSILMDGCLMPACYMR